MSASSNTRTTKNDRVTRHPFHIVSRSPWPILLGACAIHVPISIIWILEEFEGCLIYLGLSIFLLTTVLWSWLADVVCEATYQGLYTSYVQKNLKIGFLLFIVSEIMFFFALFWTFFYSAINPSIWIGAVWPPYGFIVIKWYGLPLLNTFILLSSGVAVTYAHRAASRGVGSKALAIEGLLATIAIGLLFVAVQFVEFNNCWFSINDSIYGSVFFFITGFHGIHVGIGLIMLSVTLVRTVLGHFEYFPIIGFEITVWYWHFVDVVWLFVFTFVYIWGA